MEDMIQCSRCDAWYHFKCAKIRKAPFDVVIVNNLIHVVLFSFETGPIFEMYSIDSVDLLYWIFFCCF